MLGPLATELAFKMKHTMELDPNVSVSITNLEAEAIDADDATMEMIDNWRKDNNIPNVHMPKS